MSPVTRLKEGPAGVIHAPRRDIIDRLPDSYRSVRKATEDLAAPLTPEDCVVQSMPDVSPAKWHLAHTTWFFETLVLAESLPGYRGPRPEYSVLFNSYYNSIGEQHPRPRRGMLTRPTLEEVRAYRRHVDHGMGSLLGGGVLASRLAEVITIGLNHEQQHQELMLTDIKHVFSCNPLRPAFARWAGARLPTEAEWEVASEQVPVEGNFVETGRFHPSAAARMFGDVWEWTASPYAPYPRYVPPEGALGEYSGKFMCNQIVLRGGSCATPATHIRRSYRNFFYPKDRWQFSGLRLARNV